MIRFIRKPFIVALALTMALALPLCGITALLAAADDTEEIYQEAIDSGDDEPEVSEPEVSEPEVSEPEESESEVSEPEEPEPQEPEPEEPEQPQIITIAVFAELAEEIAYQVTA